jgi:hypothetical protein
MSPSDRLQTCGRSQLPVPLGLGGHCFEPSHLRLLFAAKPLYDAGMLRLAATSFLAAALSWTASAEDVDGRYRMLPTAEGFLKLDTRSGAVSECRRGVDTYQCRLVPDEQNALQAEIDRLAKENADLREQLAKAGPPLPESPGERTKTSPILPRDEEIDRALGYMEKFLRRFMGILRDETSKPI